MTKLLDDAIAAIRQLPSQRQDEIAASILSLAGEQAGEDLDPDHLAAIDEGSAEIERGDFAEDGDVAAAFRRFGA